MHAKECSLVTNDRFAAGDSGSEIPQWVDRGQIGLPNHPQIFINGSTSQRRPPPPLTRSHQDSITRQNATLTPTVTLRPIKGAAVLMNEV